MQNSVVPLPDEHISSIAERFYVANGFENFDEFFMSLGYQRRRIKFFYDLYPQIKLYELLGVENYSEFFLKHTEYPFVAPFLPAYRQVKYLSGPFGLVGFDTPNFRFEGLRKCPICEKDDGYIKRSHNLPGVVCCYKHKVALTVEKMPIKQEIDDLDIKYAIYAKSFANIAYDIDSKTTNKYLGLKTNIFIDYKQGLIKIMSLYPNIDDFNPVINASIPKIDESSYLIHSLKYNIIDLTCKKCSTRFCTTAYGYKNDFRCPACQSKLSEEELFKEHLENTKEYIQQSPFISKSDRINLKHIKCGADFNTTPSNFYDGRRCLCENRWTLLELTKAIEKDNDYRLINHLSKEEKIKVKHLKCNQEFIIGTRNLIKNRRCPFCDSLTEDKVKQNIENMGFKLTSKYTSFTKPVTCVCKNNHTFTKLYSNLTQRPFCTKCKEIEKENKTKHQSLYRYLVGNYKQDDLIFINDLFKLFTGVKTAMPTLTSKNQLYRVSDGIYSLTKLNLSVEEQIIKTYIDGKDIVGYPIKTYFLKILGLDWNGVIHICTNKTDEKKEVYCRGKTFYIYPLSENYNTKKHNEHMIISFIEYGLYRHNVPVIKEAMYRYVEDNHLDLDYIRKHQNWSSEYAL